MVAHQMAITRNSFEEDVKKMLQRHEKYLLQLLEGQRRGWKMSQLYAPIHEGTEKDDHLAPLSPRSSTEQSTHGKFELPVSLELFIAESADVLDGVISKEPTTELLRDIDKGDNVLLDNDGSPVLADVEQSGGNSHQPRSYISEASRAPTEHSRRTVGTIIQSITRTGFFKPKVKEVRRLAWWQDLDDPNSSMIAWIYASVMNPIIFFSVILSIFSRFEPPIFDGFNGGWLGGVQIMFDILFTLEFVVRFAVAYSKWNFMLDPFNVIDFFGLYATSLTGWVRRF